MFKNNTHLYSTSLIISIYSKRDVCLLQRKCGCSENEMNISQSVSK